jgi:tetraprenyl-beta-curcumene synthase
VDASPLTVAQVGALVAAAVHELTWGMPGVAHELRLWRRRALAIPDDGLRSDALTTLGAERGNVEGAALLTIVPRRRDRRLLRLLVAFQVLVDYLDTVSERPAPDPLDAGRQLHLALVDAVDVDRPMSDYYRHHPGRDDGGYVRALVRCCRAICRWLPGYRAVARHVIRHAEGMAIQVLNHDPAPDRRQRAMQEWHDRAAGPRSEVAWFEATAAASSSLAIHALLALAADGRVPPRLVSAVDAAYSPWINATSTLLDAFADQDEDAETGNHNYLAYYGDGQAAVERLEALIHESVRRARALPRGTRHALIASGMVAMYLPKIEQTPQRGEVARAFKSAAGSLQHVQLPVMRAVWAVHRPPRVA